MSNHTGLTERQLWMVITLKTSGVQLRMRVTEYSVKHHPISNALIGLDWTRHPESPTNLLEVNFEQIAMVHTEYAPHA